MFRFLTLKNYILVVVLIVVVLTNTEFGIFSGLVFIVEKMGTILQLTMTLEAMTMGPQLGVFTMGILMPWVDATVRVIVTRLHVKPYAMEAGTIK